MIRLSQNQPNLRDLLKGKNKALLTIVMDGHGAYESVTVWIVSQLHKMTADEAYKTGASCFETVFGGLDIIYSWRSTYLMMDRKKGKGRTSGLYTGVPLKSETFIVTSKSEALKMAKKLLKRSRRFLWRSLRPKRKGSLK